MNALTVKLDPKQSRRIEKLAKKSGVTKSEYIRRLIDQAGLIDTSDDLVAWAQDRRGRGFGFGSRA